MNWPSTVFWRLCSQQRLWSVFAKKRGLTRKAGPPAHDDHVKRKFTATRPNQLWLTDITEHRTDEGKIYLCAIKDVYSNKIDRAVQYLASRNTWDSRSHRSPARGTQLLRRPDPYSSATLPTSRYPCPH